MGKGKAKAKTKGEPDLVDRVHQLLVDFEEVSKLVHAPDAPVTEEEVIAFESAHNRVRHYLLGWGK